eukprot:TRINITY_DN1034_c2_g1_i2.p1 TRINITY_DN1034_c2_g1~~TRINITY_DN1034_c2_g1_i2.p1  ORF type:complete len:240 (+),score=57.88 TRINITY_DN1034_c2_g1_i2:182-901(+)
MSEFELQYTGTKDIFDCQELIKQPAKRVPVVVTCYQSKIVISDANTKEEIESLPYETIAQYGVQKGLFTQTSLLLNVSYSRVDNVNIFTRQAENIQQTMTRIIQALVNSSSITDLQSDFKPFQFYDCEIETVNYRHRDVKLEISVLGVKVMLKENNNQIIFNHPFTSLEKFVCLDPQRIALVGVSWLKSERIVLLSKDSKTIESAITKNIKNVIAKKEEEGEYEDNDDDGNVDNVANVV